MLANSVPKLLVAVSLLAGSLSLLFNWLFWARFRIDIPVEDLVGLLPLAQSVVETGWHSISVQEWIAPHASAHRIAVGRLLMAADYKFLAGDNTLFYLGSWLSIAVLCFLYFNNARLSKPPYSHVPLFMLGLALIYTCSYTLTRNLISPINALWYISAACSALSIYLFTAPGKTITALRAVVACLLSFIAAYTTFLGVCGAVVLALLAVQSRSRHSLWVTPLMLAFVVLYMHGIRTVAQMALDAINAAGGPNPYGSPLDVLVDFRGRIFDFIIVFLSAPMSKSSTLLSYLYVIPSVCLILFGWVILARQWFAAQPDNNSAEKFYLAMATVFLGTALACALGRTGFNVPADPRYQTIVMMYWLSVSGFLIYRLKTIQLVGVKVTSMLLVLLIPFGLLHRQSAFDLMSVVQKSVSARNIELSSRMGAPRFREPEHSGHVHTQQYIEYEQFLNNNTPMGVQPDPIRYGRTGVPRDCEAIRMKVVRKPDPSSSVKGISLTIKNESIQRYREVIVSGADGGYGLLYEKPQAPAFLSSLLWGDTVWRGYYKGEAGSPSYTLVFDAVLGPNYICRLNIQS